MESGDYPLSERTGDCTESRRHPDARCLVLRTIEAACSSTRDERALILVRLAGDLREMGESRLALSVLDIAWSLEPSEPTLLAAYTCAISAHCDIGQHDRAARIEREQAPRSIDDDFARAALRLYSEIGRATGDEGSNALADMYTGLLDGAPHEPPSML